MKLSEKKIHGIVVSSERRTLKTLITTIPAVEVSAYFSVERLLPELSWFADVAVNATNVEKVQSIRWDLERLVSNEVLRAPLTLTFAVMGKPCFQSSSNRLASLKYDSLDTHIVGNVLGLVALCKVMGRKTFLFSSRLSVKEANLKSELRQRIAMEDIEVRVVFDEQQGLNREHIVELFKNNSTFDSSMSLPHLTNGKVSAFNDSYPLKQFIDKIIRETEIESYGGVKLDAKHVKVSEKYITTQFILFKMIVGAVAGIGTQEYSKMSKDVTLANGESISSVLTNGYIDFIIVFIKEWVQMQNEAFANNRSGYQLSPQVWQALGLTIHQLVFEGSSCDSLKVAAKILGQLDYSKNAKHWANCPVMELDSKGRVYKNSASSTRQFRSGLVEYFLAILATENAT